jgi:hypothetical protein
MIIDKTIIRKLEHTYRRSFPDDFKMYLLANYAQEPFPYEFSEQDLYTNIDKDIRNYEAGELDVTVKSPSEHWQEECEYLQNLYIKKCHEARDLEEYISELEKILSKHDLESTRMAGQQTTDL